MSSENGNGKGMAIDISKIALNASGWAVVGYAFLVQLPKIADSLEAHQTLTTTAINKLVMTTELHDRTMQDVLRELKITRTSRPNNGSGN